MNHCLLEVEVLEAPQVRYTQENQTPVAEMTVRFDGLRPDDPPAQIKVVGWGNLAQDLQNRVQVGARLVLEGRLRMSTVARADGVKEKRAEFTLARLHPLSAASAGVPAAVQPAMPAAAPVPAGRRPQTAAPVSTAGRSAAGAAPAPAAAAAPAGPPVWNTAPLVPEEPPLDDDDIPF